MNIENIENFASVNLLAPGLRKKGGASSPDADTQNTTIYTINNKRYELTAVTTIDTDGGTVLGSYTVSDKNWNVIYVTVDTAQNVVARVGKEGSNIGDVEDPEIDFTNECVIGRIYLYNNTGGSKTIGTANLDSFSTTLFEDVTGAVVT